MVDASHPEAAKQSAAVFDVLQELGINDSVPVVTAWNKIDACEDAEKQRARAVAQPGTLAISAQHGEGLPELLAQLEGALEESMTPFEVEIPYKDGHLLGLLRERGIVRKLEYTADGTSVSASANLDVLGQLQDVLNVQLVPHDRIYAWRREEALQQLQREADDAKALQQRIESGNGAASKPQSHSLDEAQLAESLAEAGLAANEQDVLLDSRLHAVSAVGAQGGSRESSYRQRSRSKGGAGIRSRSSNMAQ